MGSEPLGDLWPRSLIAQSAPQAVLGAKWGWRREPPAPWKEAVTVCKGDKRQLLKLGMPAGGLCKSLLLTWPLIPAPPPGSLPTADGQFWE